MKTLTPTLSHASVGEGGDALSRFRGRGWREAPGEGEVEGTDVSAQFEHVHGASISRRMLIRGGMNNRPALGPLTKRSSSIT